MSVKFDKTNDNNNGDWIKADGAIAPSTGEFAFSISLWVYFEANVSGTETIWFYGDKDNADRYLVLEARLVSGSTKLRARMNNGSGAGPTGADSVAVSNGAWHLVTVVATKDIDSLVVLTLHLDAETAVTESQSIDDTNEGDYDRFAIGRFAGSSGPANPGSFLAEQVAIWDSELSRTNHDTMYANDLNGENVRRPPTILTSQPDLGYWVLAGHRRHALRLHDTQIFSNQGDLNNEVSGQPDILLGNSVVEPVWSVKTPAVLYKDTATTGVPVRRPKIAASRVSPHFHFFAKPELYDPWGTPTPEGTHPIWDDPNMSVMARVPYDPANNDKYEPPQYNDNDYHPTSYLTQIAKRVADWFEYQVVHQHHWLGRRWAVRGCRLHSGAWQPEQVWHTGPGQASHPRGRVRPGHPT